MRCFDATPGPRLGSIGSMVHNGKNCSMVHSGKNCCEITSRDSFLCGWGCGSRVSTYFKSLAPGFHPMLARPVGLPGHVPGFWPLPEPRSLCKYPMLSLSSPIDFYLGMDLCPHRPADAGLLASLHHTKLQGGGGRAALPARCAACAAARCLRCLLPSARPSVASHLLVRKLHDSTTVINSHRHSQRVPT